MRSPAVLAICVVFLAAAVPIEQPIGVVLPNAALLAAVRSNADFELRLHVVGLSNVPISNVRLPAVALPVFSGLVLTERSIARSHVFAFPAFVHPLAVLAAYFVYLGAVAPVGQPPDFALPSAALLAVVQSNADFESRLHAAVLPNVQISDVRLPLAVLPVFSGLAPTVH